MEKTDISSAYRRLKSPNIKTRKSAIKNLKDVKRNSVKLKQQAKLIKKIAEKRFSAIFNNRFLCKVSERTAVDFPFLTYDKLVESFFSN